ncbi:MAG: DUF6132 family protein [Planctomycetota bacterium]
MLIKTIAGTVLFAATGAAIGYSQILCPDGQCSITGTPYGGALFGGVLGLAVMSSLGNGLDPTSTPDQDQHDSGSNESGTDSSK